MIGLSEYFCKDLIVLVMWVFSWLYVIVLLLICNVMWLGLFWVCVFNCFKIMFINIFYLM